jgi:catechol 2,3-dioxygenase-like lactoylglutathione lyase family enzyme
MTDVPSPVPPPAIGATAPPISHAIYGMPMFATLLVADLDRTTSWYVDGLGFISLFTMPGSSGPVLVHLRRWQFQDLLVRPASEPIDRGTGCTLSFAAVYDEIDALAARARAHGAGRVDGPVDTAWNTRDLTTVDPDGNVVIFTAARPPDQADAAFNEQMHRWTDEQDVASSGPSS